MKAKKRGRRGRMSGDMNFVEVNGDIYEVDDVQLQKKMKLDSEDIMKIRNKGKKVSNEWMNLAGDIPEKRDRLTKNKEQY